MDAFPRQRIEIDGKGGDERLALAGLHFGDRALVEHHAAHQLNVEMTLAKGALGRLANRGKGGDEKVVERDAVGDAGAQLAGAGAELVVAERLEFGLHCVDRRDARGKALDPPVVRTAEELTRQ